MKSLASTDVLAETKNRLLAVRPDDRARWGKMSATQMVRHLDCACDVALGARAAKPVKGIPPPVMKWLALRSGVRWAKNIRTAPELERLIAERTDGEFDALVKSAAVKIESLTTTGSYAGSHPFFGTMTAADWMRWGYLHADHHLRQFGR
ncbi:hypothetical protein GCM10011507_01920 [Edaphobacter acidisoli]|uniref:DUF1569 domain-containing protein n=1 Tax=Edaphobacter acidisoli TaxID=2040573 RepID=A0A916VZF1_9BACT|nr:DUF1569 domain-containing protein [Edaphobacter acidisoli]GGA54288.1 hypothetical protein GCM10011507_01920 [Edaphobacter acidisoli]